MKRVPIRSKTYNKKLFRNTSAPSNKRQPAMRPYGTRGGWRG